MIELPENEYDKVKDPLARVQMNTLFVRTVVERAVSGKVYVDDSRNPQAFYVAHPYGMSMLFGAAGNGSFNSRLIDYLLNPPIRRVRPEQLLVFPEIWHEVLSSLPGHSRNSDVESGIVTKGVRINFKFNLERYFSLKMHYPVAPVSIVRTDRDLFEAINGVVVPKYFWRDADHFSRNGIGFTAIENNEPASTALSSFIRDGQLELGIETAEKYRGRNFALAVCAALVDYCLANGYEPVWACREDNTPSYRLALKLGFEPVLSISYYHFPA